MHGHGMHHILGRLVNETLDDERHRRERGARPGDRLAALEQEVKIMYARGDINAGEFHRLMEMAESGQLSWSDLQRVRDDGAPRVRREQEVLQQKRDPAIVRSLNRIYTHRVRLEDTWSETEQVLRTLEGDVTRLREQAGVAEEQARQALPEEENARAYLDAKYEALERVNSLEERIAALRQGLDRIETLLGELATREAELKALESSEQLAELEASIREDLLNEK